MSLIASLEKINNINKWISADRLKQEVQTKNRTRKDDEIIGR